MSGWILRIENLDFHGFPGFQDSTSRQYPRKGILAIHRVPGPWWARRGSAAGHGLYIQNRPTLVTGFHALCSNIFHHVSSLPLRCGLSMWLPPRSFKSPIPPKPEIITSPDHMKYIEISWNIPIYPADETPPKYQITSIIIYPRIGVTTNGRGCCPAPLKIAEDLWNSSSRVHVCRGTLWWGTLPGHERTSGLGDSEHEKPDWTCFLRASILPVTSCYIRFLHIKILHVHFTPKKCAGPVWSPRSNWRIWLCQQKVDPLGVSRHRCSKTLPSGNLRELWKIPHL